MKEHPIPQDITNYRFHIVGSMTLKQFGEAAVGVAIAFFIYQTNLISIIKWPLVALFFGGGFAAAFVPIEERPISHWLSTFISILYKPTQFFWKRAYNIPAPFLFKGNSDQVLQLQELDLTPARRQRIKEFLSSTNAYDSNTDYNEAELSHLSSIMAIFQTTQTQVVVQPKAVATHKPKLNTRVRSIRQFQTTEVVDTIPSEKYAANSLDPKAEATYVLELEQHATSEKKDTYLNPEQVAQNFLVPETIPIKIDTPTAQEEMAAIIQQQSTKAKDRAYVENTAVVPQSVATSEAARFNAELPFPTKPTIPNKLVGMVLTQKSELIPGAIVEIKTLDGHVSRAVKTNALGQFYITTPLANGEYVVTVDKDGYTFKSLTVSLSGTIIEPIEIRSN